MWWLYLEQRLNWDAFKLNAGFMDLEMLLKDEKGGKIKNRENLSGFSTISLWMRGTAGLAVCAGPAEIGNKGVV